MMDLLGSYFLTGNETKQAQNEFDDMQMGEKGHSYETFPKFKARFQSAAITGQVSQSEWFRYMWNKLTPQFRSRVAVIKNQWNSDYHIMVRELTAFTGPTKTATSRPVRPTPAPILPPFNRTQFLTQPKPDVIGRARAAAPAATGNCF
ncbi:hypothetical protein V498_03136, partial [Pseudogymnoascus sp. VKM F-4517 (FW-2822)]